MWKFLGVALLLGGVAGVLHSWVDEQHRNQLRLEYFIFFLQRSLYVMQTEKIRIIDYFERYIERSNKDDKALENVLAEIVKRLSLNIYPNGQFVWESVFQENEKNWNFDTEIFGIIVQAGNGFFGRTREENINFLEKSIKELERQQAKMKQNNVQERKVWIPVGLLSALMLAILLL